MNFFKTRREIRLKAYQKGYEKGVVDTTREKDLQISFLKRNMRILLEKKTREIISRDNKVFSIEKQIDQYRYLFSQAKHMANRIEGEEEIGLRKVVEKYAEVTGFAGKLRGLALEFEKKLPKVQQKIDQYKITHVIK